MMRQAEDRHRGEERRAGAPHRTAVRDDDAGHQRSRRRRRAQDAEALRTGAEQVREDRQQRDRAAEEDREEIERHRREQDALAEEEADSDAQALADRHLVALLRPGVMR